MRSFFDTSTLVKKYIDEAGSIELVQLLDRISHVTVASVYVIEIFSFMNRKIREKSVSLLEAEIVKKEIIKDYRSFEVINLSQEAQERAVELVNQYPLTTLDSIQLASAIIAQPDIFVTSDKQLYKYAKHELKKVELI